METLSDILNAVNIESSIFFCDSLTTPWSVDYHDEINHTFHMVRKGACTISSKGETQDLLEGDLVFLNANITHTMASKNQKKGEENMLLCGSCFFDKTLMHPLIQELPELVIVRAKEFDEHPWLKGTLEHISSEYLSQQVGNQIIVNKLSEVVLIELLRINFSRNHQTPFLKALNDPQVSKVLALIHQQPHLPWTIEGLAKESAISRAALARRFKELVGNTIFEYLTLIRMQKAHNLLKTSQLRIYEVGEQVGYDSEASFIKTFKKYYDKTPLSVRKI